MLEALLESSSLSLLFILFNFLLILHTAFYIYIGKDKQKYNIIFIT